MVEREWREILMKISNLPKVEDIKKYRIKSRLTQKELAEKAGVSTSMINQIESGRSMPSYNTAIEIFRSCGFEKNLEAENIKQQGLEVIKCKLFLDTLISNLQGIRTLLGSERVQNKKELKTRIKYATEFADRLSK